MNKKFNHLKQIELQMEEIRQKFFRKMTLNKFIDQFSNYTKITLKDQNKNNNQRIID